MRLKSIIRYGTLLKIAGILVLGLFVCPAVAEIEYDFCARGVGDTLSRSVRLKLRVDGADLGDQTREVASGLAKRLIWPDRAREVFIENYDEAQCSAALGAESEVTLAIAEADLSQLRRESSRGQSATVDSLAKRAVVRSISTSPPPSGLGESVDLRIFFATNRADTNNPDPVIRFGTDRGSAVAFGVAHVTIPRRHRMGELESPSIFRLEFSPDPEQHIKLRALDVLSLNSWRSELRARATAFGRPGVLVFIHGYNVTFSAAAIRAAQLSYDLAFPGPTVFISWPSRGQTLGYQADQEAAEWSVSHVKAVLVDIANVSAGAPVYVIAHSMGTRILLHSFELLLQEDLAKRKAFVELVLTAPDIDAVLFKSRIAPKVLGVGPRVTLYASDNDTALAASRRLSAGTRRLGEAGNGITVLPGMDTVDATYVKTDFIGHSYFGDAVSVISDIFYLFRKMKPADRFALESVHAPSGNYWRFRR